MPLKNKTFLSNICLYTFLILGGGCTDDSAPYMPRGNCSIGFSTDVEGTQTRSDAFTTDNLLSTGIFSYYTGSDDWTVAYTPNFMYNQEVKRTNASSPWTYSPVKYWPNNPADKISFFAYAPYNAAGVIPSSNTVAGFPYLDYTVATAEADQTDLLAATPLMNQSYSTTATPGKISLTMKHALTKVTIYAKTNDLSAGKVVNSLSVTAPKNGRLTYKIDGFSWNPSAEKSTYITTKTDITIAPATADKTVLLGTFYLIPDRANSSLNITYTVTGSISDNVNPPANQIVITGKVFPDTYNWTPGTSLNYTVNIRRTGVDMTAEETNMEWGNGGTDDIKFVGAEDLKIGDYFYSDGTTSDGGVRILVNGIPQSYATIVEPTAGKTCVGVVFYTGRHPSDTGVYVNKNGDPMDVQGYAVALKQTDALGHIGWGGPSIYSNTSTDTEDFNGYSNTQKIKEAAGGTLSGNGGVPACYNWSATVPGTTSGWFCPSAGQLHYMSLCYSVSIQKSMSKVGGAITGGEYHHLWSSTEPVNNGGSAYMVSWPAGGISTYGKGNWVGAQAVIAF